VRPAIPPDRKGYMVTDGVVHTRYATHVARGPRYRSMDEAWYAVMRLDYAICTECYPPPPKPSRTARSGARPAPRAKKPGRLVYTARGARSRGTRRGS